MNLRSNPNCTSVTPEPFRSVGRLLSEPQSEYLTIIHDQSFIPARLLCEVLNSMILRMKHMKSSKVLIGMRSRISHVLSRSISYFVRQENKLGTYNAQDALHRPNMTRIWWKRKTFWTLTAHWVWGRYWNIWIRHKLLYAKRWPNTWKGEECMQNRCRPINRKTRVWRCVRNFSIAFAMFRIF